MTVSSEPAYNQEHGEHFDPAAAIVAENEEKKLAHAEMVKRQTKQS